MQGQKAAIGSLPESLALEHGSNSSESGVVEQHLCWTDFIQSPLTNANQEIRNLSTRSMGESSSSPVPKLALKNQVDPKLGHEWSLLVTAHPEPHQHEPSTSKLSLGGAIMNTTHTHANNSYHHLGHNVTVNPSTFIGIKHSNYASSSSGPIESEAQHLRCKRKAVELNIGQSSSRPESSNILQRHEGGSSSSNSSVWRSVSEIPTPANTLPFDPAIPRLGSGIRGVSADNLATENIQRNVRIRVSNFRQQDELPTSNNNNNNGLLSFSSPHASLGLYPVAAAGDSSSSREGQPILRVPSLTRNLHASSRNRSSSSRANLPVSTNISGDLGDNPRTTPTNIIDQSLFIQTAINMDLDSVGENRTRNTNVTNNGNRVASTSNPMPNVGPHRGSSVFSSRRHAEILRRALLSSIESEAGDGGGGGRNSNLLPRIPLPVGASASSSQESGIPRVIGITGRHPHHHLPQMTHRARTVAGGSERRGRLVSEMRNVLDLLRRGEGLRFEDVMFLRQSVFYGVADVPDRYRDMRLDIDNMSYEELLALEERIGNVNTGLTEDNIMKHLKQNTYTSVASQPDDEPCCICQEEYKNGDDVGALECGHDFHTSCIRQWLLQKNSCPVCKSMASK
ncbi:hypothetical protein R6Q59_029140 [Mikania micrantha]|uniref:RING-type E3 ubiquitin transferase n=1 Tax=Mikania micrantha TaxID=192012 RepID=A0A5N6LW77_9ASTR|nr:hypothetical protein E3N88_39233 [Mikania micrantha]